jgi:hypothetical protein
VYTFVPSTSGQGISVTFNSFCTESGYDWLAIYDGPNNTNSQLIAVLTGNVSAPFTYTASTLNSSGDLTFWFFSDGTTRRAGWTATVSCAAKVSPYSVTNTDCWNSTAVCSNSSFSGNSSGAGNFQELTSSNSGCLSSENQSTWYNFSIASSGTLQMSISPANGTDDYDFALWGPFASYSCDPSTAPVRCSWASGGGSTGISSTSNSPQTDNSEGAGGNRWVQDLAVTAGEKYILLVDNYSGSSQPYTISWSGSSVISCTPLPIELMNFYGWNNGYNNTLRWVTATETNNDHFTLERTYDGDLYSTVALIPGAGTSSGPHTYEVTDQDEPQALTYYRLKQTDYNGQFTYSPIIAVERPAQQTQVSIVPDEITNVLQVRITSESGQALPVAIYDVLGNRLFFEQVQVHKGVSDLEISLGSFAKGLYYFRTGGPSSGDPVTLKFIKTF